MFPKKIRVADEEYLGWVRGKPCVICERRGEPHHVKSKGAGGSDRQVVPLCRVCHTEIHKIGRKTFEGRHNVNLLSNARTLYTQYKDIKK